MRRLDLSVYPGRGRRHIRVAWIRTKMQETHQVGLGLGMGNEERTVGVDWGWAAVGKGKAGANARGGHVSARKRGSVAIREGSGVSGRSIENRCVVQRASGSRETNGPNR